MFSPPFRWPRKKRRTIPLYILLTPKMRFWQSAKKKIFRLYISRQINEWGKELQMSLCPFPAWFLRKPRKGGGLLARQQNKNSPLLLLTPKTLFWQS